MNINKIIRFAVIALVVLIFVAALTTFTVRFNETAVVSTFGKADESSVRKTEGLGFIFPYAQRVTKYDKRARYVEPQPETAQTQDARQLIVSVGLTWRVSDPLKFFKAMSGSGANATDHYKFAEDILKTRLRGTMGEVAQKRLDQILAASSKDSKLSELEANMLAAIRRDAAASSASKPQDLNVTQSLEDLGIEALSVGIVGVSLPQDTTRKVFEGMNTARQSIANEAINQGKSQAATVRSKATADADRISKFADRLASSIRARGDEEAQVYLRQMKEDADLAVFLRTMEFMKSSMGKTTTLVLPTSMPGMEWFRPDALKRAEGKQIPGLNFDALPASPSSAPSAGASADRPTPAQPEAEDRR